MQRPEPPPPRTTFAASRPAGAEPPRPSRRTAKCARPHPRMRGRRRSRAKDLGFSRRRQRGRRSRRRVGPVGAIGARYARFLRRRIAQQFVRRRRAAAARSSRAAVRYRRSGFARRGHGGACEGLEPSYEADDDSEAAAQFRAAALAARAGAGRPIRRAAPAALLSRPRQARRRADHSRRSDRDDLLAMVQHHRRLQLRLAYAIAAERRPTQTPTAEPKFSDRVPQEQAAGQAPGSARPTTRPARRWRSVSCSTRRIRTILRASVLSAPPSGAPTRCRPAAGLRLNSKCVPTSRFPNAT